MRPCHCTELTGECRHDCPDCAGEGFSVNPLKRASTLTAADMDRILKKSQKHVAELHEHLASVFRGAPNLRVR